MTTKLARIARAHLDAWQSGDADAVAGSVDSYQDPDTADAIAGADLARHATEFLHTFRNARFEVGHAVADETVAVLGWTMAAEHRAPYRGVPATNTSLSVSGVDTVTQVGETVRVARRFDRLAVLEALGYQGQALPVDESDRQFGTSSRTLSGRTARPGALVLTSLQVRDDAESAEVDLLVTPIVTALRASRGFLGMSTFDVGDRKFTVSTFDSPTSVRAVHARPHQRAVRRFFQGGLCLRSMTSVWEATSVHDFARCPRCGAVVAVHKEPLCECGWSVPDDSLL
ncbi:ester cyclase [Solwaraspora sp. WMMD406]|uniref:ester cyclase n=1 Tax=Solwaraspora sp. WMMD406 TaxID=3016095 RepID=UPI0024169D2B|nr:ester cyclase [Solwaraspora sp. WMMD406]MDG4765627.1 ester cyclase [Solwaraspora sp. WMMD406]